jgi:hypothetical protein
MYVCTQEPYPRVKKTVHSRFSSPANFANLLIILLILQINSEDLAELGVPEAHEQLALIRNTMREAKEAGAAGVKNVKKK